MSAAERELAALNTPEPRPARILHLLAEAEQGRACDVTIADALEFRREQYGLSKHEFASILGLALSHYGEILGGNRRLPLKATKRAFAIGVPADVLLQPEV